jgi:hypothetical protein
MDETIPKLGTDGGDTSCANSKRSIAKYSARLNANSCTNGDPGVGFAGSNKTVCPPVYLAFLTREIAKRNAELPE